MMDTHRSNRNFFVCMQESEAMVEMSLKLSKIYTNQNK